MKEKRNLGLEVYRVIAIVLIVLSHTLSTKLEAGISFENYYSQFFYYCGQIGVAMFVISSAYFLCDSNIRRNDKMLNVYFDCLFFSLLALLLCMLTGVQLEARTKISMILPFNGDFYWFVSVYLIYYFIHPYLNMIIEQLEKRSLWRLIFFGVLTYCTLQIFLCNGRLYCSVIGFVLIYFITAYYKKYMDIKFKKAIVFLVVAIVVSILSILALNYICTFLNFFESGPTVFANFVNPIVIVIGLSLFAIFKDARISEKIGKVVACIEGSSLQIYVAHTNPYWTRVVQPAIHEKIDAILGVSKLANGLLTCMLVLSITVLISALYRATIRKLVMKLSDFALKIIMFLEQRIWSVFV